MGSENATNAAPVHGIVIKPLKWSGHRQPDKDVPHDHQIAETPFGRFVVMWKSWKSEPLQDMGVGFDESPWGIWYIGWDTPEEAMREAEEELAKRIAELLA